LIEQKSDENNSALTAEMSKKRPNWVPWTAQQTFYGVLLTLIPWMVVNLSLSALGGNTGLNQPLSLSQDLGGAFITFIFTALVEGVFLIAPYRYAKRTVQVAKEAVSASGRAIFETLGLRRFNLARMLPWIVGLLVVIFASDQLYGYVVHVLHLNIVTNDQVVLQQSKFAPMTTYALLAGAVLIAPICEELFFRGFVLPGLLHELSPFWAVIVSAALFAIAHVDPSSFLPLFVIGLALGFVRLRSGSTWASISLHVLNNLLSSTVIILAMHHINVPSF
jgi:membrane protease YdiL (CAAX protease family)